MLIGLSIAFLLGQANFTQGDIAVVAEGCMFTEGPVWLPGTGLLFSDIPADAIFKADKTVFRKPSGNANGLMLDRQGRLIACEHGNRRVTRAEKDGSITVLADRVEGKRFNSPNDVIVRSDGAVFFTDPPYGLEGGLKGPNAELDFSGVYAILPDGELRVLARDFIKPNGIGLSPDEKTIYIADTDANHIRAFDVAADGTLSNGRVFFDIVNPDGMAVDTDGNVWTTGGKAVTVVSPKGELLQAIDFPLIPSNCTFGGGDGKTLYVTARAKVFSVRTSAKGVSVVLEAK